MECSLKTFLKKNWIHIALGLVFGGFILVSYLLPIPLGIKAGGRLAEFFIEFASFIPFIFILIGLFDVWFPKAVVERHIGPGSGLRGIFWVTLLAMLQAGPLYGAFPVAYLLLSSSVPSVVSPSPARPKIRCIRDVNGLY